MISAERFADNGGVGKYVTNPVNRLPAGGKVLADADFFDQLAGVADARGGQRKQVVLVDVYPGGDVAEVSARFERGMPGWSVVNIEKAAKSPAELDAMLADDLTEDRVFGRMNGKTVKDFYDSNRLDTLVEDLLADERPTILCGWGAAVLAEKIPQAVLVLVDMARWEIQLRQRSGATNWQADNPQEDNLKKYKRGFFVEWRAADRHKSSLFDEWDFVLDGNRLRPGSEEDNVRALSGADFRQAMSSMTQRPFRVVPFFDPGVWGGEWMQTLVGLERHGEKYAWCFDCVPEENSLVFSDGTSEVELPAMDLTLSEPDGLLGSRVVERFGAEFPIRFDLLDTMGGGNLSLQVHPLRQYIKENFGMAYTQDESYYILDAEPGAVVYLGLKEQADVEQMVADLRRAESGEVPFDAEKYVNKYPAKKHDHFAIPAGTIHCSGVDSMVLEISATPYIFTFKLWDWDRLGLDGLPRPVHIDHGARNIQGDRDSSWVRKNLLDQVDVLNDEPGVVEERTGLHESEFIEVRRHWFTGPVEHDTRGTVNVLNLVEGDEVQVVSPTEAFEPMIVHYAETFIIPAALGRYRIEPTSRSRAKKFATVKAYVRGTEQ